MKSCLVFTVVRGSIFDISAPHGFRLDGVRWPSVWSYITAGPYAGTPLAEAIRQAANEGEVRHLVREANKPVPADWRQTERALMKRAFLAQCKAHPRLAAALLATGSHPLVQDPGKAPPYGAIWKSDNRIGFALMKVRASLRRSAAQKAASAARREAAKNEAVVAKKAISAAPDATGAPDITPEAAPA